MHIFIFKIESYVIFVFFSINIGKEPPSNASQEEYDRWLAFQLASTDDDVPPSDFNKKHKPVFRRSLSMPEQSVSSITLCILK